MSVPSIRSPTGFLFAPNFLVNTVYRSKLAQAVDVHLDGVGLPCRLVREAGFVRGWFARVNGLQTTVNARPAEAGERAHDINGVLMAFHGDGLFSPANDGHIALMDPRFFEPVGWQELPPADMPIWMFVARVHAPPDADFPILQSGVDLVVEGCLEHGEAFAIEYLESCGFWSRFWLDDREVPRRPWVHQPAWERIDRLLAAHPRDPARNTFAERRLPEAYGERFLPSERLDVPTLPMPLEPRPGLLVEPPAHFVFGFGSLINTESRRRSNPEAGAAVPVQVQASAGLRRGWNFQAPAAKLTALGVERHPGVATTINGVVYPCQDLVSLDARESGYARRELSRADLRFLAWKRLPPGAHVWVYVPDSPEGGEPGTGLGAASFEYPILQSYIDVCVLGALEHGEGFALEFLRTTAGWSRFWLNDRKLARRPWVHQPRYQEIDVLLARALGDEVVALRRLSVEYGLLRDGGSSDGPRGAS